MPALQSVLNIAIPAIVFFLMLAVGMDLTAEDFRKVRRTPRSFFVGTFCQYLLPLVALLTLKIISPSQEIAAGMILLAAAPGGGISNYYTYLARANVALSVVLTAVSCVAAAITMPVLLRLFEFVLEKRVDFHVPWKILFGQLVLLLVLPVLIGAYIRHVHSSFVAKYDAIFRRVGLFSIAALIAFILQQTSDLFMSQWQEICIVAAVFVGFSMGLGYLSGLVFRLTKKDCFTILIEFGVRNVAIATTAAVVILRKTEFATFAATYFLVEAILILSAIFIGQKYFTWAKHAAV